jgi:hypothetical protein
MFDVCTTGDTAHIDTIFKLLPHTRHGCIDILHCCNDPCLWHGSLQQPIHALVGRIYQNESSFQGHESFTVAGVILAYAVSTSSVSSSIVCVCVCVGGVTFSGYVLFYICQRLLSSQDDTVPREWPSLALRGTWIVTRRIIFRAPICWSPYACCFN